MWRPRSEWALDYLPMYPSRPSGNYSKLGKKHRSHGNIIMIWSKKYVVKLPSPTKSFPSHTSMLQNIVIFQSFENKITFSSSLLLAAFFLRLFLRFLFFVLSTPLSVLCFSFVISLPLSLFYSPPLLCLSFALSLPFFSLCLSFCFYLSSPLTVFSTSPLFCSLFPPSLLHLSYFHPYPPPHPLTTFFSFKQTVSHHLIQSIQISIQDKDIQSEQNPTSYSASTSCLQKTPVL